jgi:hypothetical protein
MAGFRLVSPAQASKPRVNLEGKRTPPVDRSVPIKVLSALIPYW